jgi:hypothetical protein
LKNSSYPQKLQALLVKSFVPAGYTITRSIELDPIPESAKYAALSCALNEHNIIYRKAKVTPDRPGAFLAIWQRPMTQEVSDNKPIPFQAGDLDYLFVQVASHSELSSDNKQDIQHGMFIFPVSLLVAKGVVSSPTKKGKTGFRVFPPWSQNRGIAGTKIFSESGKKTQRWQLPYFVEIDSEGFIESSDLNKVFSL